MLSQSIKLFIVLLLATSTCFSAISSEDEKLMEELSGQSSKRPAVVLRPLSATISERHLSAGLNAFKSKNYILALKHYNTVIIKHSKSKEVKSAFLSKAKLYAEMGLTEQAELNLGLAQRLGSKISK